uniref:Uncharacterized protein n=1 Tax=Micrurus carvalhoi TaxID=3147026 RepID=A0A2H6NDF8_9SAUR
MMSVCMYLRRHMPWQWREEVFCIETTAWYPLFPEELNRGRNGKYLQDRKTARNVLETEEKSHRCGMQRFCLWTSAETSPDGTGIRSAGSSWLTYCPELLKDGRRHSVLILTALPANLVT